MHDTCSLAKHVTEVLEIVLYIYHSIGFSFEFYYIFLCKVSLISGRVWNSVGIKSQLSLLPVHGYVELYFRSYESLISGPPQNLQRLDGIWLINSWKIPPAHCIRNYTNEGCIWLNISGQPLTTFCHIPTFYALVMLACSSNPGIF